MLHEIISFEQAIFFSEKKDIFILLKYLLFYFCDVNVKEYIVFLKILALILLTIYYNAIIYELNIFTYT